MISWHSEASKPLESAPGAVLRYKILSVIERNRAQARVPREVKQAMSEAFVELRPFQATIHEPEKRQSLPPADEARVATLLEMLEALETAHTIPEFVREGLIAIDGVEIDGQPVTARTVDTFLAAAPGPVIGEVYRAIIAGSQLTPDQQKNLQSPFTSSAAVQGEPTITTADTVSETGSTTRETASATSPATS